MTATIHQFPTQADPQLARGNRRETWPPVRQCVGIDSHRLPVPAPWYQGTVAVLAAYGAFYAVWCGLVLGAMRRIGE